MSLIPSLRLLALPSTEDKQRRQPTLGYDLATGSAQIHSKPTAHISSVNVVVAPIFTVC